MTDIPLSKSADKFLCTVYKAYLLKVKKGMSKTEARNFFNFDSLCQELFPKEKPIDVSASIKELRKIFKMKVYINDTFVLSDDAIIYMENRLGIKRKGIDEKIKIVTEFILSHFFKIG